MPVSLSQWSVDTGRASAAFRPHGLPIATGGRLDGLPHATIPAHFGASIPLHFQRGLALIGFGLLIGFFGLIWVANLFGVADEHARQIAQSRLNRWFRGFDMTAEEVKGGPGFKVGRYAGGAVFMMAGLFAVGGGLTYLAE